MGTLQKQHVLDLMDLNSVLNNTQIVPIGPQQQIIIRGIGNNFIDTRADPAVQATSINGLFYTRPLPVGFGFLDVSRVEDLEGPQSPLRPQLGGRRPQHHHQSTDQYLRRHGAGQWREPGEQTTSEGVLNIPITDDFAVRAAYDRDRRDGYLGNFYDDTATDTGRISARWTPTTKLTAYAEGDYIHIGGHGPITEAYPCGNAVPWSLNMPASLQCACAGRRRHRGSQWASGNSYVASGQLHLDYDLGPVTVTSISGYVGTHMRAYTLPNAAYFTNTVFSDSNDYSEEIRFSGHDSAGHQGGLALAGREAYLFSSTGDYFQHAQLATSNRPPTGTQQFTAVPQSSEAGYAQVTWVTDQLRVTGGIRYTADAKGISYSSSALFAADLHRAVAGGHRFDQGVERQVHL